MTEWWWTGEGEYDLDFVCDKCQYQDGWKDVRVGRKGFETNGAITTTCHSCKNLLHIDWSKDSL